MSVPSSTRHAPPSNSSKVASSTSSQPKKKVRSEFLLDLIYENRLPDPPFEPKLLNIFLPPERLLRFCGSSLEQSQKPILHTERFLGIPLDLIDLSSFESIGKTSDSHTNSLSEGDAQLFPEKTARPKPTREQLHQESSTNWLSKVNYDSNNLYNSKNRRSDMAKPQVVSAEVADTPEAEILAIEKSFTDIRNPPVHPENKNLKAEQVLDILPDEGFANEFLWTEFDAFPVPSDQTPDNSKLQALNEEASKLLLKQHLSQASSHKGSHKEYSVYLSAPNPDDEENKGPESEKLIKEYAYNCGRKYVTQNTPAVNAENNYFLIERPSENKLFYGRYNHRIKVVKEPVKKVSHDGDEDERPAKVFLQVMNEEWNDTEEDISEEKENIVQSKEQAGSDYEYGDADDDAQVVDADADGDAEVDAEADAEAEAEAEADAEAEAELPEGEEQNDAEAAEEEAAEGEGGEEEADAE